MKLTGENRRTRGKTCPSATDMDWPGIEPGSPLVDLLMAKKVWDTSFWATSTSKEHSCLSANKQ